MRSECPQRRSTDSSKLSPVQTPILRRSRSTTWSARCLVALCCSLLQRIQLRQSIGASFMGLKVFLILSQGPRVTNIAGVLSLRPVGIALAFGAVGLVWTGVLFDGAVRCGDAHLVDASPGEISAVLRHSSKHILPTGSGWSRYRRRYRHHLASLVCSRLTTSSYDHAWGACIGVQLVSVCLQSMAP